MAIRALVFDFDGIVADTEGPEFEAWRATWADYGHELALEEWARGIGTVGGWDPVEELGLLVGDGIDPDDAQRRRRERHHPAIHALDSPMPGVLDLLVEARERGLRTAIASSSDAAWVPPLLEQLDLVQHFEHLSLYDGTCPAKPAPDLYLRACAALEVAPPEAIAFEDSPNGVAAAKAAGLWCVAIPHEVTRTLDLSAADLLLDTLDGVGLDALLRDLGT
jgi:HAD superfamily hydrolase (TIGR01509 family)